MCRSLLGVHPSQQCVIRITFHGQLCLLPIPTSTVRITPSITFTLPNRPDVILRPLSVIIHIRPYYVYINRSVLEYETASTNSPCFIHILEAIRLLSGRFITSKSGLRAKGMIISQVTKGLCPNYHSPNYQGVTRFSHQIHTTYLQVERVRSN